MKFFCDNCNAQYMIADEKVGTRGVKVKCKKCAHVIVVKPAPDAAAASTGSDFNADKTQLGLTLPPLSSTPPADKVDAELSGAFDSLLSESSAGMPPPSDAAAASSGTQEGAAGAPAGSEEGGGSAAPVSGGEKVWYVAVDDRQVGPIDLLELTRMWQEGRIKDETLGWRAGMPDWVSLVEIPELLDISNGMGPRAAKADSADAADAAASTPTAKPAAIEWKPSAASALSSLVQDELLAQAAPKEEAAKPPSGVPDLGFSGYASGDLFGGQVQSPPPPGADAAAAAAPQWSVPQNKPKSKSLAMVFGLIGVGVVLLAVIMVAMVMRSRESAAPPPKAVTLAQPPPAAAPAAAPAAPAVPPPATANNAPPSAPPASAPAAAPAAPAAAGGQATAGRDAAADRDDDRSPRRRGKRGARGAGRDARPAAVAAAEPGGSVKPNLTADDVRGGVRQYASKAIPCLRAARSRNEIGPGEYTFTLDWVIQPDGSVRSAELKSPAAVLDTSLPACFQAVLSQWRFPASQNGAPVRNFPFGPVKIP